jgi:hypothetical protein
MGACHEFDGQSILDKVSLTKQSIESTMNIVNQEDVDPLEETTMLIWDPGLPMPFDDLFQVQEPPEEARFKSPHNVQPPRSSLIDGEPHYLPYMSLPLVKD